jgi:UDP-glucose 4-epimerase
MLNPTKTAMTNSFHKVGLTGGAYYFGSYMFVKLLNAGLGVAVFDNFCNNHLLALARVAQIAGKKPTLVQVDIIQESEAFGTALRPIGALEVIHFVGLNSVYKSVQKPLTDYENNVAGCLNLLQVF